METQQGTANEKRSTGKGPGSFCIPRAAIEALLNAQADVYTIGTYLTLACFTEEQGMYSVAGEKAASVYLSAGKMRGGKIPRALQRLKEIHAFKIERVSNGRKGNAHQMIEQKTDLGPILFDRETWVQKTGEILPDGPTERGKILHVLPTFGEQRIDRVWFGRGLVEGHGTHEKPLRQLKSAGDVAARLLLSMYAANDMETWGGVRPVGHEHGPWLGYASVADNENIHGGGVLIRSKEVCTYAGSNVHLNIKGYTIDAYWEAIRALESYGLFYQVVLVLNRNATPDKLANGDSCGRIPDNAEPSYELDCRSLHGYKPKGEEGLGSITARTAGDLGAPVTTTGGVFDGTYAAIVRRGQGAMIAGIFRPRYRVSNPSNAGVKGSWARIHENNREAFAFIESVRAANKLPPMVAPWTKTDASTAPADL